MLMADVLPCALLEGCVVTGASTENLKEAVQAYQGNHSNLQFLDPEVLQVHVPPFVTKDDPVSGSHGHNTFERNQRRRSYIKKKKEKLGTSVEGNVENKEAIAEDISVPKDIDLIALPQLCFPGGLQVSSIEKEDCFHFLVFTDVFGNRSHGVVVQYYKQVQVLQDGSSYQNGQPHRALSRLSKLYAPYAICLISKYAYYNALKDCLSCLRLQLKSCRDSDIEDRIKEFAAKLTLVPTPPPGHLHLVFNMKPLQIVLPSQEDVDGPVVDIDLHFPFLCFKPKQVLKETDDIVLINIDRGTISTSFPPKLWIPDVPAQTSECFLFRVRGLQMHYDLELSHLGASTDLNHLRSQRRQWQQTLNLEIQQVTLELIVNIFRMRASLDIPIRPTIQEMARKHSRSENGLSNRLGMSMPNLSYEKAPEGPIRQNSLKKHDLEIGNVKIVRKSTKLFKLPEFPPPLVYYCIQNYYNELISLLSKAILSVSPEDSALLARYYYLRGLMNTMIGKRLDALADFQNLYKTDIGIFPNELLKKLVDSLVQDERCQVEKRPELKRLISKLKKENEGDRRKCDDHVKTFELPKKHMQLEDFVKSIQESGIVKDNGTIHRLFDALTVGQQKQIDPETFKTFYTFWKESEAEAQDVHLPVDVIDHLDNNECVYKLSCSVKTSYGVGKIAMTQKRLFLLTEGRPGYIEITKFRDIEELKISSATFLLLRIPSLKIKTTLRKETFEANLKSECDLWHLMVKEMWAGRKMADEHKDPQYMQQALTNALLMDAVVGCLQSQKAIYAASKLAYFDRMKLEVPMMVPKTTSEMLKHKINPSANLTSPLAVDVLLYTPGHLNMCEAEEDSSPKLWCALDDGKVVVFDAASWSLQPNCIQVGSQRLVWIGSRGISQGKSKGKIYVVDVVKYSVEKELVAHTDVVQALCSAEDRYVLSGSSSEDGKIAIWKVE
ncbi:DEND3 protein, partial [Polypterus senegalus]